MVASPRGDVNLRRTNGNKKKRPQEIVQPREMEGDYDFTNDPRAGTESSRNGKHVRDPPGERHHSDRRGDSGKPSRSKQKPSHGQSQGQGTARRHITKRPDPEDPLFAPRKDMRRRSNANQDKFDSPKERNKSKSSRHSTTSTKDGGKKTKSHTFLVVDDDSHGKVVGEYRRHAKSSSRTVASGSTRGTPASNASGSKRSERKPFVPPIEARGKGTSGSDSPAVLDTVANSLVEMIFSPQKAVRNRDDRSEDESYDSRESVSTGTSEDSDDDDDDDVSDESSFDVATRNEDDEQSVFSRMTANISNAKQLVPKADPLKYFMSCTAPDVGDGARYKSFDTEYDDQDYDDNQEKMGYCAAAEPFGSVREEYVDEDHEDYHDDYSASRGSTERSEYDDDDRRDYDQKQLVGSKPFNVAGLVQCLQPTEDYGGQQEDFESHGDTLAKGQSQTPEYQWRSRPNGRIMADGNGNVYKGDVMDGMRHGYGSMRFYSTRDEYQGQWAEDKPHGWGKVTRGDKMLGSFEGFWEHGTLRRVKTGFASVMDDDGNQYAGNHENWKRHGEGTMTTANGEKYTGLWSNGLRHGYGIIEYTDGTRFEGLFQNDVPTNEGHTFASPAPGDRSKRRQFVQQTTAPPTRKAVEPPEAYEASRKERQSTSSSSAPGRSSTTATSHNTYNTKQQERTQQNPQEDDPRPDPLAEKEKKEEMERQYHQQQQEQLLRQQQEELLRQQQQQLQQQPRRLSSSKPPRAPSKSLASSDAERREEAPPRDAVEEARLSLEVLSNEEDEEDNPTDSAPQGSIVNVTPMKTTIGDDLGKPHDDDYPLVATSATATTAKSSATGTPTELEKQGANLLRGRAIIMQRIRSATKVLRKLRKEDGRVVEPESLSSESGSSSTSGSFAAQE